MYGDGRKITGGESGVKKIFKRVYSAVISFALAIFGMVAGIFPAALPVQAETALTYEQINVLDDLANSTIDGKEFSLNDFNFDSNKETRVISFVEYCYSFYKDKQDNYGLYVYVYNPQGLRFDTESPLNSIQFTYGLSTTGNYTKYSLSYLNCSLKENYEGLFYKFKVSLSVEEKQKILQTINSSDRVYRVSGIELLTQGDLNATEYSVATTYHYSGYASGQGSNIDAGNTLQCNSEQSEVLSLDVHATQYRPKGTNGKNDYTQDSLHSVYFAVPNEVLKRYGAMIAVHAKWLDAVLNPALVTGNQEAFTAIQNYLGAELPNIETTPTAIPIYHTDDLSYMYYGLMNPLGGSNVTWSYGYGYNALHGWSGHSMILDGSVGGDVNPLYMLFNSGVGEDSADNYTVQSEIIYEELKASATNYGGELVNGKYAACMFESVDSKFTELNIHSDDEYDLTSEIITQNWWQNLWGTGTVVSTTFDGIKAIYPVSDSDFTGSIEADCNNLYIGNQDYTNFKKYYEDNKTDSTVYLFRYQVSDYISQEATLYERTKKINILGSTYYQIEEIDTNAYFFQETVNLDFDIIDVTFSNGEKETIIPIVSSPIDVIPDPTPPVYTEKDGELDWRMYIGIIAALIILAILLPILSPIIKFLAWLISLPFKLIGKFLKWIVRRRKGL